MSKSNADLWLLPRPQQVKPLQGRFKFPDRVTISLTPESSRQELVAARQLADDLAGLEIDANIARRCGGHDEVPGGVALRLGKVKGGDEAYTLDVEADAVTIVAQSYRGLYYGVQSLRQLLRRFGRSLPAASIADWPELKFRGVYHDISRGRVPKIDTLKYLIELLGHLKVNALSLYIEYPYRYERHPQIWEDTQPLSAENILELQQFCVDHCIDFIPSQASFGHLERLLSKPPYHKLANTPPRDFAATRDYGRSGCSLDPTNPASVKLLAELYDEFLPQFDSKFFIPCCDEVWDLGEGRSAARAAKIGKGPLFTDFICQINRLANRHGKRTMIWADILKHHPEAIGPIPKDVIFLNWWYYDNRQEEWMYEHSRRIVKSGHPLIVCPGVNNWGSFVPRTRIMRDNIRGFAAAGHQVGAIGLLNTEWGDGGHFNLLATALPGFATGAEESWAHSRADEKTIGRRWPLHVLGDAEGLAERIITLADRGGYAGGMFTGFGDERKMDFKDKEPEAHLVEQMTYQQRLVEAFELAMTLSEQLGGECDCEDCASPAAVAAMELAVMVRMAAAKGLAVMGRLQKELGDPRMSRKLYQAGAETMTEALPFYEDLWLARNRPSELDWSVKRVRKMITRWRSAARA